MSEQITLPDPKGGCCCASYSEDRGGGYFELMLEYEPACPEHSVHLYNPRTGVWELSAWERDLLAEPDQQPTAQPTVEDLEDRLYGHKPVTSMADGALVSCQCLDRLFRKGEDWGTHLAEVVLALLPGRPESVVKAEALREAAVACCEPGGYHRPGIVSDAWLRDRADRIEANP